MRGRGLMLVAGMRAGEKKGAAQAQQGQAAQQQQAPPPATTPTAPASAPTTDVTAELTKLANLHSSGVLTDQEFADAKKKALGL